MKPPRFHTAFLLGLAFGGLVLLGDEPALNPALLVHHRLRREPPPSTVVPAPPTPRLLARGDFTSDRMVRRAQSTGDLPAALPTTTTMPSSNVSANLAPTVGAQSLSLDAALYGALTSNPDLVTLRQGNALANAPSPEAVEVARRFPTSLNPTVWIDYRPITLIPKLLDGSGRAREGDYYRSGQQFLYFSLRQPLELGHQTTHRYGIARAALEQQRWVVTQAELTALVQTYRFFQTAAYRREKERVARDLNEFNERLQTSLEQRLEANQAAAADVILARVESRASRQQVKAARQDYLTALTDLRNQIGIPETAGESEPLGEFTLPPYIPSIDEQAMLQTALANRPDIHAARAQLVGAEAAVRLAQADRIPSPVVGPEYQTNENGSQFVGMVLITPIPIVNNGKPLLIQRRAEAYRAKVALYEAQQRVTAQVRSAVAKWNGATELVKESSELAKDLAPEVVRVERLFDEGQADLTKLMQVRQRLLQLENARLDAVWAATQAQADLLLALGSPNMIRAMLSQAERGESVARPDHAPSPTPSPSTPPDAASPAPRNERTR